MVIEHADFDGIERISAVNLKESSGINPNL